MLAKQLKGWIGLGLVALAVAGCSGLSGEPSIIATMPPARATAAEATDAPVVAVPAATQEAVTTTEVAGAATEAAGATTEVASAATPQVRDPNATAELANVTPGVISGAVVNKTAGGSVPPDLTLNLHIFSSQDTQDPGTVQNATVNADGSFRFENVPVSADSEYVVTATYQQAVFSSEVIQGDPANPQIDLPLNIYEVTSDPANIQIDGMLMMLQATAQPGELQVVQIVSFNNTSDRVFLKPGSGDSPTSVSVRLPSGAVFQDFSGGSYAISADGAQVSDTQAVLPGSSHVMHVAFNLPYSGSASIVQPLDYPLNGQVEVMVQNGGMSVTGDNMTALGTRQLGDRTFTSYGGAINQPAGASLSYGVSGTDPADTTASTTTTTNGVNPLAYVLIAIGLLAIGAAFGFFLRERTGVPGAVSLNANKLMKQIADLDVQYHNGKLPEARYRQQRSTLKAQLVILMKDKAESTPSMDQ